MLTTIITRTDVTVAEVTEALRHGLGPRYNVLPDTAVNWNPAGEPRPDQPDTIVVGTGSTRAFRAQVKISRDGGVTGLHVSPGGLTLPLRLTNLFWIARRVHRVLRAAPRLQ